MIFIPPSLRRSLLVLLSLVISSAVFADPSTPPAPAAPDGLMGLRFLTLNTIVRARQIEVTREQVNLDLHDGLKRVSEIVGDGYRPKSVVAGFLSSDNLRYLSEKEGIHVFQRNGFAWVTCGWEMSLVEARKIYGYGGRNGMDDLNLWLTEIRKRWPDAQLITQGEFGELWRAQFKNNEKLDYQFVHHDCGIRASEADQEIRWFMNLDFCLALLRNWKKDSASKVIDFTRFDQAALS